MDNELITKFQELKAKHNELVAEKMKYEAKKEQLCSEMKVIQDKYPEYDLSTAESVKEIVNNLTEKLNTELNDIIKQYEQLKVNNV
jgi:hypothetical protein